MVRRAKKVSRLITHRLSPELFPGRADELAELIADNLMNLSHVATATGAQPRAVRRWVKVALERGKDVLELARQKLRERGVDPGTLPAEKVRTGMKEGRDGKMSDRSDTPKRTRGRPPKTGPKEKVSSHKFAD